MDLPRRHQRKTKKKNPARNPSKQVSVLFDQSAFKEYQHLKEKVAQGTQTNIQPGYAQLLRSIEKALEQIQIDPFCGDLISRRLISKATQQRYGTHKLWRMELVGYWRLLYTVTGDEAQIRAFILEYMDHTKYNKVFGYRGR